MTAGELAIWSSDEEALSKRQHCYSPELVRQAWDYLCRRPKTPKDPSNQQG